MPSTDNCGTFVTEHGTVTVKPLTSLYAWSTERTIAGKPVVIATGYAGTPNYARTDGSISLVRSVNGTING